MRKFNLYINSLLLFVPQGQRSPHGRVSFSVLLWLNLYSDLFIPSNPSNFLSFLLMPRIGCVTKAMLEACWFGRGLLGLQVKYTICLIELSLSSLSYLKLADRFPDATFNTFSNV